MFLVFQTGGTAVFAQFSQTNAFPAVNAAIPDGLVAGMQDSRTITSDITNITAVRVRLKVSGNFNGDLYGYLRHTSGGTTRIGILLNRPGRVTTNSTDFGYSDSGFDVTVADAAAHDIHTYRTFTNPPAGTPLVGTWQPDARFIAPELATTGFPRSAFLSGFNGLSAGGDWTLFLADVDPGGTNFLTSWGLEIAGKVTPGITWPQPAAITYGTALGAGQLNATSSAPGTFGYNPPAGTLFTVGSNRTLSVTFTPTDTNSYVTATANVPLDILPQPLTLTANSTNKIYGSPITLAGTNFTTAGLVNGDTVSNVTLTCAGTGAAAGTGDYDIVPSAATGTRLTNYVIQYVNGTLTVNPAALLVHAANQSRLYGQPNPPFTASITGFVNSEDTNALIGALVFGTAAGTNSPVGSYAIVPGGLIAINYAITFSNGTLTVTPFPLTVSADNAARIYGATNPPFTGALSALQNGDNIAVTFHTVADTNSPVGAYPITPAFDDPGGELGNYGVLTNLGTLTVGPAALTATADNQSRAYAQTNPVFTVSYAGFVNADDASVVSGTLSGTSTANTNSPVGNYPIQVSGQSATNYTISYVDGTLTVHPAALLVQADDASRALGQTNPLFAATFTGFANGQNVGALGGALAFNTPADTNSPPGFYPIAPSGLTATNYAIAFSNGTLRVTLYAMTATANNFSRSYGATNPPLTGTLTGLQEGANITATFHTTADTNSPVGSYAITPTFADPDGNLTNYTVFTNVGALTVTPALLTGTADNASRLYGQTNPPFTASYSGFVNGEGAGIVTGTLTASTPAHTNSPAGNYPIQISGQSAPNYTVQFTNGTLTVAPTALLVKAHDATRPRGLANPPFSASITGFVNGQNTNALGGTLGFTTPADTNTPVGAYPIVPGGLTATNYAIVFSNGTLNVTGFPLTMTADNKSRSYGATNPPLSGTLTGLQPGDNITVTFHTPADTNSPVGAYPIAPDIHDPGGRVGYYSVFTNLGTLTVGPAALLVSANAASRVFGQTNPPFTPLFLGLVNGESPIPLAGTVSFSTTADTNSPVGAYPIIPLISDPGSLLTNYNATLTNGNLTIGKAATTLAISTSLNPAVPGSNVTFAVNVTALAPGSGTPSGAVQYKVDGTNVGAAVSLVGGHASFGITTIAVGAHAISAAYLGDGNFLGTNGALGAAQVINTPPVAAPDVLPGVPAHVAKIPVSVLLTNDSDADGDAVSFDTVSPTSVAGGTLSLADGWVLYNPAPGFTNNDSFNYFVHDTRGGYATGTVAVTMLTGRELPVKLAISKAGVGTNHLTFAGVPWGNYAVEFTDSLTNHNWAVLTSSAADMWGLFACNDNPPGNSKARFYRAHYLGDGLITLLTLTSSLNPAVPGAAVTFTAHLDALNSSSGTPGGTVQFKVDGTNYGAPVPLTGGYASRTTATLPVGEHSVRAEYSGDVNFPSATGFLGLPQLINTPPVAGGDTLQRDPVHGTKVQAGDLLANDYDADSDALTFQAANSPTAEGGTLTQAEGWIFYTPPAGFVSADSFTYTMRDSHGAAATGTVQITTSVGNAPSANLTVIDLGGGSYRLIFSGVPWENYIIQHTENLALPDWHNLATNTADSHGVFEYVDTLPPGTTSRYYRSIPESGGPAIAPLRFAVWTNFIAHTNGRTMDMWGRREYPPGWPNVPPVLRWNTNCLLYGLDGFTAISQCNEFEGSPGQVPVTLLTRRHGYARGHGLGGNGLQTTLAGKRVWFCTASNTVVPMTIAANVTRLETVGGNLFDYTLVAFTEDVPGSITPIHVISPENKEIYYPGTPYLPDLFLATEQEGHCAANVLPFLYPISKGGDSGSPNMIPSPDNQLIMFSGRTTSGFSPQLAADLEALSNFIGLNPASYPLRWYDLSPWEP